MIRSNLFGRVLRTFALGLALAAITGSARAEDEAAPVEDTATLFQASVDAIAQGRPAEAIAKLEALGDRGVVDAVVSYDRGLAYAARIRAGAEQSGDLGRAAHGFEEARELSRDPALVADATRALASVRAEVARRRARAGDPIDIDRGISLGRSLVELLPENAWATLALLCTVILAGAIAVRSVAERRRPKVAATTTASIAGILLVITSILLWSARDARLHLREGVVVAAGARLLDARHIAQEGVSPIAEGARVQLLEELGGFSRVAIGSSSGFVPSSVVLPISKR